MAKIKKDRIQIFFFAVVVRCGNPVTSVQWLKMKRLQLKLITISVQMVKRGHAKFGLIIIAGQRWEQTCKVRKLKENHYEPKGDSNTTYRAHQEDPLGFSRFLKNPLGLLKCWGAIGLNNFLEVPLGATSVQHIRWRSDKGASTNRQTRSYTRKVKLIKRYIGKEKEYRKRSKKYNE